MKFDIITIFPKIFDSYINESIIKRAQEKKLVNFKIHNLRDFTTDKHHKVDDRPFGGGAGMVLKAEPILRAVKKIIPKNQPASGLKTKLVLFSAKGKQFNQKMAYDWVKKFDHIVFVTGRYEGIDERARQILSARGGSSFRGKADLSTKALASVEEISIGPYVLTDGDVAAMAVVSAITRLIPGVINWESLEEESFFTKLVNKELKKKHDESLEYPHYTRPEVIEWQGKKYRVPKVLISGNHKGIGEWRSKKSRLK